MNTNQYLTPEEITEVTIQVGIKKTKASALNLFILGILAGVFIAFASEGSNMAAFNLFAKPETYGLGKALAGAIFGTGLMLVVIAGGELFTGNTLFLAGSLVIVSMMNQSGLFSSGADMLGGVTIKIAAYKVGLEFMPAFYLGIMCNWLVCLAVWMAYGAKDMSGKILAIFFPIWLFITSGFEHSIANMYYIPAGIFAKANPAMVAAASQLGVTAEKLSHLNWSTFFINNLIPVTLGNIVGGGLFVGGVYWFVYIKNNKKSA